MTRCLKEAMPAILKATAQGLQPQKSVMAQCSEILSEVNVAVQDSVKASDQPLSPSSDCRAISEEMLEHLNRLAQELQHIQPDENRSSLKQTQVQPCHITVSIFPRHGCHIRCPVRSGRRR